MGRREGGGGEAVPSGGVKRVGSPFQAQYWKLGIKKIPTCWEDNESHLPEKITNTCHHDPTIFGDTKMVKSASERKRTSNEKESMGALMLTGRRAVGVIAHPRPTGH